MTALGRNGREGQEKYLPAANGVQKIVIFCSKIRRFHGIFCFCNRKFSAYLLLEPGYAPSSHRELNLWEIFLGGQLQLKRYFFQVFWELDKASVLFPYMNV